MSTVKFKFFARKFNFKTFEVRILEFIQFLKINDHGYIEWIKIKVPLPPVRGCRHIRIEVIPKKKWF
jgi:hypothetical protein